MEKQPTDPEKERHLFHLLLAIVITCLFFVILNIGVPVKVLVLIVFSIILTFATVFFCVWCLRILEEKRIIDLSRKEFDLEQQRKTLFETAKSTAKKYRSTISQAYAPFLNRSEPPTANPTEETELNEIGGGNNAPLKPPESSS